MSRPDNVLLIEDEDGIRDLLERARRIAVVRNRCIMTEHRWLMRRD